MMKRDYRDEKRTDCTRRDHLQVREEKGKMSRTSTLRGKHSKRVECLVRRKCLIVNTKKKIRTGIIYLILL